MLYRIKTYPFCNIAHQQAIFILNSLKESFDAEDVGTLKNFIFVELEAQKDFNFPSGHRTSGINMGQITQIAFELKNLTQQALNDESSDGEIDEDEMTEEQRAKHRETSEWMRFCKEKIVKIEKVWNRKLEESSTGAEDTDSDNPPPGINGEEENDEDNQSHEDVIS